MCKKYLCYMHIFPNGKKYVGITCQDARRRWMNGYGYQGQYVYQFIKEYGWENIEHVILKNDMNQEEALEYEAEMIKKYNTKTNGYNISNYGNSMVNFEYSNKVYSPKELLKLSSVENLTIHDLTTRINYHNWSIERAINQPKMVNKKEYEYNGNYYNLNELYRFVKNDSITIQNLASRLSKGWDVDRALSQPTNKKNQPKGVGERKYEYNGKMYNSYELSQMSKLDDITPFDITDRINHHGWSVERAISQPKRKRKN